ncbi:MAG: VWA domain-containing protein [Acidobacteriota bacterium]|nr:MAG: VWA domain-containing protein [Acidobacteriota bacterium]
MFEFDALWAFALLPAPLVVWWLLPPYKDQQEFVRVPFFEQLAGAVGARPAKGGVLLRRNILQKLIAPIVWIFTVVALARPQYVEPPIEKIESARDLMLAVDLSGSMDRRDMFDAEGNRVPISRLDMVKQVLDDFIERREGDRIGVIVFGTEAFLQAPFTLDHDLVRILLGQVEPRMAGPQTMMGDAIGLAIKVFEGSEAEDRVLILLTDGNDTGSRVPPRKAAGIAAQHDVTVHTVAVGDPSAVGEAQMDLETLEAIATSTGGSSFAADDREQLEAIYQRIDALTPEDIETISYRPTRPLFHWPLGIVVGLVLVYHFVMGLGALFESFRKRHA